MPATAGRVKMPHNNRMSTSATLKSTSIWANTIGYDPHKNREEEDAAASTAKNAAATEETVKNVMQLARTQNVTDGAKRDDFTAKLYLGLKKGKVRRSGEGDDQQGAAAAMDPKLQELLEGPDSSSEEEYVQVHESKEGKTRTKQETRSEKKKRKKRRPSDDDDDSDSSSDDDSSYERRKRRREKRKRNERKKKKHSKRSRDLSSDDSGNSSEGEARRRRKSRKRRKEST